MKNPWLKKNPFMSLWLSGANSIIGSARAQATAEARRQGAAVMAKSTKQANDAWMNLLGGKPPAKRRRRKT